jgi:ribokinase
MRAVVVGSLNMDLVLNVPALPSPGQTILSRSRDRLPGGKGANQAVALARLGAGVAMVGAVGDDPDGAELLAALEAAGVSTRHVSRRPRVPTGLAVVCVTADGDNAIVVASGANATLTPDDLATAAPALPGAGLLLLQLEIPLETVLAAARAGRDHGVLVVLNAAPARDLPTGLLATVDVLVVNDGEAAALAGGEPRDAAVRLRERGPRVVVVTRGGQGCVVAEDRGATALPADPVEVVDTTGAGDCFAAALGFGLAEGRDARQAARFAAAAAALAVTRPGAQATPSRAEVEAFVRLRDHLGGSDGSG